MPTVAESNPLVRLTVGLLVLCGVCSLLAVSTFQGPRQRSGAHLAAVAIAASPSTIVAAPTTTVAPATTQPAAPAPAANIAPATTEPAAAARTDTPPDPGTAGPDPGVGSDLQARAEAALEANVPSNWLAAIPYHIDIISGWSSYATTDWHIHSGSNHAAGPWSHLEAIIAHEFGHLIAYRYGTYAYLGAPPAGWPDPGYGPTAEAWADCVSMAFTGIPDPGYGMPVCSGASLSWTQSFLAAGPPK